MADAKQTTTGEIYVRDFEIFVPSDCVAALRKSNHRDALAIMQESFQANTTVSSKLNLNRLLRER